MTGRHQTNLFETDNLQADVMRFMAIIAFCLIAILALVQKLDNDSPAVVVTEKEQIVPVTTETKTPAKEKKLTLRFVSDGVFLKLIRQERIKLYGGSGTEFRRLQPDFTLETAKVQGDLWEVMPESLPQAVRAVFSRHQETDLYLVSLPDSTAEEVARLTSLHAASGGEMLINEQGRVRYEQDN